MTGAIHPYDDLKAYCDGELTPMRRWLVRLHVAGCASCREEIRLMQHLKNELTPSDNLPLDPALRARILAEAASTPPSVRTFIPHSRRATPLQLAATLGAALVLAAAIGGPLALQRTHKIAPYSPVSVQAKEPDQSKLTRADGSPAGSRPAPSSPGHGASESHAMETPAASLIVVSPSAATKPPQPAKPSILPSDSTQHIRSAFAPETDTDASKHIRNMIIARSVKSASISGSEPMDSAAPASVEPMAAPSVPIVLPSVPASIKEVTPVPVPFAAIPPPPPAPSGSPGVRQNFAASAPNGTVSVNGTETAAGAVTNGFAFDLARSVHREAMLTVQVKDLLARDTEVSKFARDIGGDMNNVTVGTDEHGVKTSLLVLTVPAPKLDVLLAFVSNLGTVTAKHIVSEDITQKISDANAARQTMEANVQQSEARNSLRGKEGTRTEEEAMPRLKAQLAQAQLTLLQEKATHSTVTVTLSEMPSPAAPTQAGAPPKTADPSP